MTTSSQPAADSAPGMLITMSLRMLPVATPIASIASEPCTPMVMRSSSSEDLLCLSADGKSCVNDDDGLWDFGEPPKKSSGLQAGFGAGGHVSMDDSILGSQSSSRARNVRNVLSIFKRRNSEINVPVPALDVIESWSQNFSEMLKHEYGLRLFKNFLCSEYSEENIEFWMACEEYKTLKSRQYNQRAQKIYSDFVTPHAPKEVNLDSKTRLETMKNLSAPDANAFDQAQHRIQCLMEKDSFPRFLRSSFYTDAVTQAKSATV